MVLYRLYQAVSRMFYQVLFDFQQVKETCAKRINKQASPESTYSSNFGLSSS